GRPDGAPARRPAGQQGAAAPGAGRRPADPPRAAAGAPPVRPSPVPPPNADGAAVAGGRPVAAAPATARPEVRPDARTERVRRPVRDGDTVRERRPAAPAGRERTPVPGRDRTPPPGRPMGTTRPTARQRLMRQRLVVFVTVTLGVALAIAVAQGCESRATHSLGPAPTATAPVKPTSGATLSVDSLNTVGHGGSGLGPALGSPPSVDWLNRSYPDPSVGPAIQLREGHSTDAGAPVTLTAVLPARYRDAPATLVVLRRVEGSVPVDLVQLYGFTGDAPVLIGGRASTANPEAGAVWRVENGALIREERVDRTGAVSSTRYTVRQDGSLEESWPGAGVSGN
ncbi:hypothetical protein ACFV18_26555, partial [Kitasatospora sp. NPDC059673]